MLYILINKNVTSNLATIRRVIISWFNLCVSSVLHHDPSVANFFQEQTEKLNGEKAATNTSESFKSFKEVLISEFSLGGSIAYHF